MRAGPRVADARCSRRAPTLPAELGPVAGGRRSTDTYARSMRVLLTGMSGTGKSTLVQELRRRGHVAWDADDDGFSEPRADGRWGWRADAIAPWLAQVPDRELLFFAGCSEEQVELPFDHRVVLTVPRAELVKRLRSRTSNPYGRAPAELTQVLADLVHIEPLLRRSADLILTSAPPVAHIADQLLAHLVDRAAASRGAAVREAGGRGRPERRSSAPARLRHRR